MSYKITLIYRRISDDENTAIFVDEAVISMKIFTDGFPELQKNYSEMFGYDRVKREFKSAPEKTPKHSIEHLKNAGAKWAGIKNLRMI